MQTIGKRSGFTLLEMLAAMAMMAVLAGSLYAALNAGFRAKKHSEAALEPVRAAGIAFDIIGRDVSCIPPPRGILAGPFTGDAVSMAFFTRLMSTPDAAPGIAAVGYQLVPHGEGSDSVLIRYVTVNLLSPEQTEPFEEKLCYGVKSVEIRYFDGTQWLEVWDSTAMGDVLPVALEISVEKSLIQDTESSRNAERITRVFILPCAVPATGEITL